MADHGSTGEELRDKTGAGMMECKAALHGGERRPWTKAVDDPAQARARAGRQEGRPRDQQGPHRQLHPHGRQDRRARRGELRVRLRGAHRRLPDPREGARACTSPPPTRSYVRREDVPADVLEKEKDIYRAQMAELGQAGARSSTRSSRASSDQLLRAGRAARPAVDPRPQGDDRRSSSRRRSPRLGENITVSRVRAVQGRRERRRVAAQAAVTAQVTSAHDRLRACGREPLSRDRLI